MYNLPVNTDTGFLLLIFALFEGALVFILIGLFIDLFLSARKSKKEYLLLKQESIATAQKILLDTQKRAQVILEDAQRQADALIKTITLSKEDLNKTLNNALRDVSNESVTTIASFTTKLTNESKKLILDAVNNFSSNLTNVSTDMAETLKSPISTFEDLLQNMASEASTQLSASIKESVQRITSELIDYKKERMSYIDSNIHDIIYNVALEVVGKTLNMQDHERLVQDALSSSKFKAFFSSLEGKD